jgi:hypothetical protein
MHTVVRAVLVILRNTRLAEWDLRLGVCCVADACQFVGVFVHAVCIYPCQSLSFFLDVYGMKGRTVCDVAVLGQLDDARADIAALVGNLVVVKVDGEASGRESGGEEQTFCEHRC